MTFVEFHLVVPGDMTVDAAHGLCDRIEAALLARLKDASITIHVEPESQSTGGHAWSDDREGARQIMTGVGIVMLKIYEGGSPPRFRLWSDSGQSFEPRKVTIETVRPSGVWRRFTMADRDGYMESIEEIPEPHAFTAYLKIGAETYAVDFVKHAQTSQ